MAAIDFPYEGTCEELAQIDGELTEVRDEIKALQLKESILEEHRAWVLGLMSCSTTP